MRWVDVPFEEMKGKVFTKIEGKIGDDTLLFFVSKDEFYTMKHFEDCCEDVYLEDICGPIEWLLNSPILLAEKRTNSDQPKDSRDDSFTWTFYELATLKGAVTLRWYVSSNGYYSEAVDFGRFIREEF